MTPDPPSSGTRTPALRDIAEDFQRQADECRDTAARIQKRIDGGYAFNGDAATKAHYARNAWYFQVRADVIQAVLASAPPVREPGWQSIDEAAQEPVKV